MSEVKVTPLARRLAEENGIDWRRLNGTGPENTVVERDILGFLAKVMAG
ncbi:MAG: dihydrolipoamide acyltransferase, partial [Meiothermus sp.]